MALATCSTQPHLYEEERELLPMLRARGVDAHAVVWSDPTADWSSFDAVVLRSTWDYFERLGEFHSWLARLEHCGVSVWNRPSLVRWNSDKLYLRDLERRGVRVIPTFFFERGARVDGLEKTLTEHGWNEAILKPSVSGNAYRTRRVDASNAAAAENDLDAILESSGALIQPFFPEIETEGEWSFFFFTDQLSHVVLKAPAPGDYRVQPAFGGSFAPAEAADWMKDQARAVLAALPEPPMYARIDGVCRDKTFYLMEAELIEPYLYLTATSDAAATYVRALETLL